MHAELYENLGFKKNPFSTFSAEEEVDFIDDIFVNPLYLKSLKDDIASGHSRFILGARGIGKTSLIIALNNHCQSSNIFSVVIDEFEGVPVKKNKAEIIKLIIESMIRDFSVYLIKSPFLARNLDSNEKEKLSFVINNFFKSLSDSEFDSVYNKVTGYKFRNSLKRIYNKIFNRPVNIAISGGVEIISDTIRNALGLPDPNNGKFYKTYLPELVIDNPLDRKVTSKFFEDEKTLKTVLNDISSIILKSGLGKPVIFFDKIDEYPKLSSNIANVSSFVEDFLKDTNLLLNNSYSLVFSIWDALKPDLTSKGVRFDKIKPVDITWTPEQMDAILKKRVNFFSAKSLSHDHIFESVELKDKVISLASNSPRYMFRLLSVIYDQQNNTNSSASFFTNSSIDEGMLIFSRGFDFYAVFPGRRGTKDDVMTAVNRLLRVSKKKLTTKDFIDAYKVSTQTAINYIKVQQDYGLVKKTGELDGKAPVYEIQNVVVGFLIDNGVKEVAA